MALTFPRRLRGWRFLLFNVVLGLGHIVVLSNAGGYTATVPHAAGDLEGVFPSFGTWGTTDFMIGLALGFPVARWLAGRYGDYRIFIAAFLIYGFASFVCSVSENLLLFLLARVLLGISGGITLPVGQALLINEYPERIRSLGLGVWGVFTLLPFTVGIPLGGWFAEHLGWRFLFFSNIPVSLTVAGGIAALLYGRGFRRRITRFDSIGFVLLAIILFGIQTILNQGNDFEWFEYWVNSALLIAVVVALPCFVVWELGERHPALDIRLFAHRNFTVGIICSMLGFLCIQGLLSVFVSQLQLLLGYSSDLAGLVYLTMVILSAPLVAVVHELIKGIDARLVASLNFLGMASTLFWIGIFDDPSHFDQIFWPMLFLGFFLASFFAPLAVIILHGLPPRSLVRAAEEAGLLRTAAGAFGIALQGVVVYRRTPFHQLDLADHIGGRRFAPLDLLQQFSGTLEASGVNPDLVTKHLGALASQHATLLAVNDAFLLSSFVFLGLTAFVWLARPTHVEYVTRAEELREIRAEGLMDQP